MKRQNSRDAGDVCQFKPVCKKGHADLQKEDKSALSVFQQLQQQGI